MGIFTSFTRKAAAVALSAIVCVSAYADGHDRKFMPISSKKPVLLSKVKPTFKPTVLKAPVQKASSIDRDILIDEDFSGITAGSEQQPDTVNYLASTYYEPGPYIDPSLTKDGTWAGDFVHAAGGMLYLKTPNPQAPACLMTPLGDYSGDITVTCKVKAVEDWIITDVDYETGDTIWGKLTGSSLNIAASVGGYDSYDYADTDLDYYSLRLYENRGWTEVELHFTNYSADNDGYIFFSTEGAILIDDIKITTSASFIAPPKVIGVTDFQKDQLTVAWEPVRKAFNYYIDFYKRVYTADEGYKFTEDFENYTPQEGWTCTSTAISETEGNNGSKAIILADGDTLATPDSSATYKNAKFYMKVLPGAEGTIDYWSTIYVDMLIDGEWEDVGYFYADGYADGYVVDLAEAIEGFDGMCSAIRIVPSLWGEGESLIIDDIEIETNRPSALERVFDPEFSSDWGDSNYTFYDYCEATNYTFYNLDPETEYYYGIRSHYVSLFSKSITHHALGVCSPVILPATDVDSRGSFTANWEAAPKAQAYTVDLYGVYEAESDVKGHALIDEDFSKVDENVTTATDPYAPLSLNNFEVISLDDYTKTPGWTGTGNTVAVGMLGCEPPYYYLNYITTPEIYVGNSNKISVTLEAYGTADDYLAINVDGVEYYCAYTATSNGNGVINGTFSLPVTSPTIKMRFSSYNYGPFMLGGLRITQDLKAGDIVRTKLESVDTDSETTSYTFNNLDAYDYDKFGYMVTSHFAMAGESTTSAPSDIAIVDLGTGESKVTSGIEEIAAEGELKIVGRYAMDGTQLAAPQKGINILKMSDGTTRKVLIK